ncbi:MAG: Crp/Fnr family transcriptional regulator [Waterburya sp.]
MLNTLMPNNSYNNIELQTFAPSELIPLDSNCFWLLQQGIVKTCTWTEEGTPMTLGYWGKDDVVGQALSLVYPYQVKCITTVKAAYIPTNKANSAVAVNLIQRHVQQTEELLYIMRTEKVLQRLCNILTWLAQKFGKEIEIGQLIDLRITHQDLAEIIGATRVTVTKLINQLEQEGFLSRPERNTIVVQRLLF